MEQAFFVPPPPPSRDNEHVLHRIVRAASVRSAN